MDLTLYFGMKVNGSSTLWLNPQQLVLSLLKPGQQLIVTKYFTSRVRNNPDKERRQKTYIEALETLPDFRIAHNDLYDAAFLITGDSDLVCL